MQSGANLHFLQTQPSQANKDSSDLSAWGLGFNFMNEPLP